MRWQNVMLRSYVAGNFSAMLREVSKDLAMLVYLDGAQNRKGASNENFAREVMELFSLAKAITANRTLRRWRAPSPVGMLTRT